MGGIISLLDDEENHTLYNDNKVDFCWIPVKGGKTPTLAQVDEAFIFAQKVWSQSRALVIHCSGGRKRTATLIASLLIKDKQTPTKTLELIQEANPAIKLNKEQIDFIQSQK